VHHLQGEQTAGLETNCQWKAVIYNIGNKCNSLNTLVYLQPQIHGLHVSTIIESSSGPEWIQIQLAR